MTNIPHYFPGQEKWYGICSYCGPQTTIIELLKQVKACCKLTGINPRMKEIKIKYEFDEDKQVSLTSMLLRIATIRNIVVTEWIDVIHSNVPILFKLDLL